MTEYLAAVIAQAESYQPLAHYGLVGAVVLWLGTRVEKRLDRLEHVITGLSKTLLIELLDRPALGFSAKRMAEEALAKIGEREK